MMDKCCVISAVGKRSLHHHWRDKESKFDLHLIVYDDSYDIFKPDSPFITQSKGYKFNLVYDYFMNNKHFIDDYKYFYVPDDDILIDSKNIHRLFKYMEKYKLAIAQPAIANSYYSHPHTLYQENSKMRYTNFVEIMQPCFSRDALKKILFTFNENKSGWGIDFHWGTIVDHRKMNMAIIDDVLSYHTRPVQSNHREDLYEYVKKYKLDTKILITKSESK